jgi:hypothetical protein
LFPNFLSSHLESFIVQSQVSSPQQLVAERSLVVKKLSEEFSAYKSLALRAVLLKLPSIPQPRTDLSFPHLIIILMHFLSGR